MLKARESGMGWTDVLNGLWGALPALLLFGVWVAWWLGGVNWKKAWPVLAGGAWAPLILLGLIAAGVWSRLDESDLPVDGWFRVPNFLWKLGGDQAC
jgi:hypothetical protein